MTTVPSFIYLPRAKRPVTSSVAVSNGHLLSQQNLNEDGSLDKSKWGMLPGVWLKDENDWVLYDVKIARRILKAHEIGIPKVKFSKAASASSPYVYANTPPNRSILNRDEFMYSRRSDSSDSSSSHSSTGAPEYEVDLVKMKEVHLESGTSRDIKIVRVSVVGCVFMTFSTSIDSGAEYFIDIKTASRIPVQDMMAERFSIGSVVVIEVSSCGRGRGCCKTNTKFRWGGPKLSSDKNLQAVEKKLDTFRSAPHLKEEEEKLSVSWKDEVGWRLYDDVSQHAIWSAWTAGENFVTIEHVNSKMHPKGTKYSIDLKTMQQSNSVTGDSRPIQIALWISSSKLPHMWIGEDFKYLTREVEDVHFHEKDIMLHRLALSRLFCPEYVRHTISENMEHDTFQSMEMNSDLASSGQWNGFLHSFIERAIEIPDYLDHLWKFALNPTGRQHPDNPFSRNSHVLWRFVFGAPSDGREGQVLRKSGAKVLPSSARYHTHIDWFGLSSTITEFYCKPVSDGCVSMLVFLAIMPRNFHDSRERVVFLREVEAYLPVASIKVRIDDRSLGPACSLWEESREENSRPNPSSWEGDLSSASTESRRWRRSLMFGTHSSPLNFL